MIRRALAMLAFAGCSAANAEPELVQVEQGDLTVTVDVTGAMRSIDADRLGPPATPGIWNFKIAMMAAEGSEVAAGVPVLAFDTSELERRLEEKIAERDGAITQLELKAASAKVARQDEQLAIAEAESKVRKAKVKADAPKEITAVIELEKARLELELAEIEVAHLRRKSKASARRDAAEIASWRSKRDRAEERVAMIRAAIAAMTVVAPRAGTVIYQADWEGKKKKVGDNAWRQESVLQVVSLARMQGDGEIDEVDIRRVATGQAVALRVDAQADVEIRGRVGTIAQTVQRAGPDNPLKVAHLDVAIEDALGVPLRPGMRFRGTIAVEHLQGVAILPVELVSSTPSGPIVRRRTAAGIEEVAVVLGPHTAERVVIESGLEIGDEIVRADAEVP